MSGSDWAVEVPEEVWPWLPEDGWSAVDDACRVLPFVGWSVVLDDKLSVEPVENI